MFPNLFEATKTYWRKLDELEASYQQGEVSLKELDSRVAELMAELAQERRLAFVGFWHILRHWFNAQGQSLIGFGILVFAAYGWVLVNSTS
ncbi:hypothetical protein N836_07365 [Leptolyngbya sp. Heron Island J]|uniref:hypothetical protein n=1 Tax=Leptolyngbya sp. Heron Island J TaxID=1385935 RepID=UPI0003B940E2|nr:hypothetical protein [Leptolyngbya sp. Heron Island J]ESA36505.1 hypothetical protein N836_07365 [Leptolyngbya sp. Heron Island J]